MNELVQKWLLGVSASLTLLCISAVINMYNTQRDLVNFRDVQFPLEKQLLLIEHAQQQARLTVLENETMDLEDQLRELR